MFHTKSATNSASATAGAPLFDTISNARYHANVGLLQMSSFGLGSPPAGLPDQEVEAAMVILPYRRVVGGRCREVMEEEIPTRAVIRTLTLCHPRPHPAHHLLHLVPVIVLRLHLRIAKK